MPLSNPQPRSLAHTRKITCTGYQRDDGLWDIEGHLVDTKPFPIPNRDRGGEIPPGEPLHDMWVRLTIDDELLIHAAEACIDWSPFARCPGATDSFESLVGLRIAPGWNRQVRQRIGGSLGCTHINEMLAQIATTAIQTIYGVKQRDNRISDEENKMVSLQRCFALPGDAKAKP
jgi:hypothetical protein